MNAAFIRSGKRISIELFFFGGVLERIFRVPFHAWSLAQQIASTKQGKHSRAGRDVAHVRNGLIFKCSAGVADFELIRAASGCKPKM
jgi:hypothetical protein